MSNIIPDQSISGNKISGGIITNFASTGIQDLATATSLIVTNNAITVNTANIPNLNGNVTVNGNLGVTGSVTFEENININKSLTIGGNLTANTLTVQNLIANVTQNTTEPLTFTASAAAGLNGMGLVWSAPNTTSHTSLLYKNGVLSSNMGIDLSVGLAYTIAGAPVISATSLGPTVTVSNLTSVGALNSLVVNGDTQLNSTVEVNGAMTVYNHLNVNGVARFAGDVVVGTLTANKIITPNGSGNTGNFTGNSESDLNGLGLSWSWPDNNVQLIYRNGNRIWSSASIDLDANASFNINNVPMLTASGLGPAVTTSNLRTVGTLNSLNVGGDAEIGQFAFFNSTYNRFGIGLEEPNLASGVLENNVELVMGSPANGYGQIGTYSNHDLQLITDNLPRVTIKANGAVNIGDAVHGGGALNVYGTLFATSIQTDNRIDRTHPLQFNATAETTIYGLGLVWNGTGATRQLIMNTGPDRLWTSESFDLGPDQAYYINGDMVLHSSGLGNTVLTSNLTKLGTLSSLTVGGDTALQGVTATAVTAQTVTLSSNTQTISADAAGFTASTSVAIKVGTGKAVYADANQITIGDSAIQSRPVKVFGPLSVNVNNPDPSLQFSVAGDVNIGGKRFTNGSAVPTTGVYQMGDICWNTHPQPGSFIGWVCVVPGTPGQWSPFGIIA